MRHGFWCHWKWVIWCFACFWGPRKSAKCCRGGMHAPKYFILGILLLWTLKDTFAKLYIFRTSTEHWNTNFPKFFFYFWRQLRAKVIIKGVRRREGDMLHWISGLRHLVLGYENAKHSYVYKTIAKKNVPLKLGQLWLCQTFYSRMLLLSVVWMSTFLCPD